MTATRTRELARILALPRRTWTDDGFAATLSDHLRRPGGTQTLRPVQAQALYEITQCKGGLLPMRVGSGKTLVSLLAALVLGARRPLLILPAHLIPKTERERKILSYHWHLPTHLRMLSYQMLGRIQAAQKLDAYQPDMIFLDEAHRAKNPRAAVTKRLARYIAAHPECAVICASGTLVKRSLKDYAHLARWSLGAAGTPLPTTWHELEDWAQVIDPSDDPADIGALAAFGATVAAVREGFRDRLVSTPGIVASGGERLGCSLTIDEFPLHMPPNVEAAFAQLRGKWELPDGSPLLGAVEIFRHARELALGFFYRWDPAGPKPWLDARREWGSARRKILGNNHLDLDSDLQVTRAVQEGRYPWASDALGAWVAVEPSFTPKTVAVWLSTHAVDAAAKWLEAAPGIAWVEHVAFGEALSARTGLPYYRQGGYAKDGTYIEAANGSIIASIASNIEGRNLQAWSRSLVVSPPPNGLQTEQLLGRTHREGQEADEVIYTFFMQCSEHRDALTKSIAQSQYVQQSTGQEQKLTYADMAINVETQRTGVAHG